MAHLERFTRDTLHPERRALMRTTDSRHDATAETRPHSPERAASLDASLDALADPRCRSLLGFLADAEDDAVAETELAARLARARRSDEKRSDASASDPDPSNLCADLHHAVLPKLDDADLLDYDADSGLVSRRPDAAFESICSAIEAYEREHADALALDALCDLLSSYRRRNAYRILVRHGDLSLPDLADEVAVAECGRPLSEVDPDHVLQIYLSLYHTHVPKLGEAGLVAYDQDGDHVALTETGRELESPARRLVEAADA